MDPPQSPLETQAEDPLETQAEDPLETQAEDPLKIQAEDPLEIQQEIIATSVLVDPELTNSDKNNNKERKEVLLKQIDDFCKNKLSHKVLRKCAKDSNGARYFYKEMSNGRIIAVTFLSLGMGLNLFSIYDGAVAPFVFSTKTEKANTLTLLVKVGATAASMLLATKGVDKLATAVKGSVCGANAKGIADEESVPLQVVTADGESNTEAGKSKKPTNTTKCMFVSDDKAAALTAEIEGDRTYNEMSLHEVNEATYLKDMNRYEPVVEQSDDQKIVMRDTTDNSVKSVSKTAVRLSLAIAALDASFDAFLAAKTGTLIAKNTGSQAVAIVASIVFCVWNFVPGAGCAYLGSTDVGKAVLNAPNKLCSFFRRTTNTLEPDLDPNIPNNQQDGAVELKLHANNDDQKNMRILNEIEDNLISNYEESADEGDADVQKFLAVREKLRKKVIAAFGPHEPSFFERISMWKDSNTANVLTFLFKVAAAFSITSIFSAQQILNAMTDGATMGAGALATWAMVAYFIQGFDIVTVAASTGKEIFNFLGILIDKEKRELVRSIRPNYIKSRCYVVGPVAACCAGAYLANAWGAILPISQLMGRLWSGGKGVAAASLGYAATTLNSTVAYNATTAGDMFCPAAAANISAIDCNALEWAGDNAWIPVSTWVLGAAVLGPVLMLGPKRLGEFLERKLDGRDIARKKMLAKKMLGENMLLVEGKGEVPIDNIIREAELNLIDETGIVAGEGAD
ncbi:MAG: hypothetical protein PUP46_00705 [Endozoicomonas sp. (ex Botrylloides leachii)]|nr:hypothetical protein [Endozoicomonas sp. (ex Botrylloides leachii)]